jgi:hypothetical protein
MLLGQVMRDLQDEARAASTLMALGDIVLVAQVDAARLEHEESVGEYVAGATQRFARLASDEDWLRLTTALERTDAPAEACIRTMVRWDIAREAAAAREQAREGGCSCGSGGCNHEH